MRYLNLKQIVPWFDAEGMRQYTSFHFKGSVDRRRVRRMMRKTMRGIGIKLTKQMLTDLLKSRWNVGD